MTHDSEMVPVVQSDRELKDAVWELLSHRGERPGRVLRGGQELWETWVPAFRAAMRYLPDKSATIAAEADAAAIERAAGIADEYARASENQRMLCTIDGNDETGEWYWAGRQRGALDVSAAIRASQPDAKGDA